MIPRLLLALLVLLFAGLAEAQPYGPGPQPISGADVSGSKATTTGGTTAQTLSIKLGDWVDARDIGLDPTGVVDAGAATSAWLAGRTGQGGTVQGFLPKGTYTYGAAVNPSGRNPTWIVAQDAFLNAFTLAGNSGWVVRPHKTSAWTFGNYDNAAGASVIANPSYDEPAQITGVTGAQIATYASRDSVGLFTSNTGPPPNTVTTATYTATTIIPGTAVNVALLQVGMFIDTQHTPKYSGTITGWAGDGSSVTVSGWYQMGNTAAGQVPSNAVGAYINPITAVWSQNANVSLGPTSLANQMTGYEQDVSNNKTPYVHNENPALATPSNWAFSAACIASTFGCGSGYIANGNWYYNYQSTGAIGAGFAVTSGGSNVPTYGFTYNVTTGNPFNAHDPLTGNNYFTVVGPSGNTSFGQGTGAVALNFFASGGATPFRDAQVIGAPGVLSLRSSAVQIGNSLGQMAASFAAPASAVNFVQMQGATTANPAQVFANGTDTNIALKVAGKGTSGVLNGLFTSAADPTTTDVPTGFCVDWNNTTAVTYKHVCNFAGTLRSVAMN